LQIRLRTIQRGLRGIDLRLRERGLLRRRASRRLVVGGLVLAQRRLGLFERRLQVGGLEFGEHGAGLDLLADGDVDLSQLAGALESQWNAAGIGDGASRGNSDLQRAGRHRRSRIGQRLLRIRQRIREEGDIGTGDDDGCRETYQQEAIGKGRSGSRYYGCHGDLSLGRSACPGNRALE
jgi:hypothetical protein